MLSALTYPISPEHQSPLRLKCCFVISSTPRAPLPRLSIHLFIHVLEVCTLDLYPWIPTARPIPIHAVHNTPPQLVSPHHNQSRQKSDAARCNKDEMCFHRDTASATHCEQKAPTEGTENTYRDLTRWNKKRWCMSEPCTCRIQTVRRGQVVKIRATGNWCTTVDCGAGMSVTGN